MRPVGLGAVNGLIVAFYFFVVYGTAGLRLVLSPLVALSEKAHLGPALFVTQKLGFGTVATTFFAGCFGTLKIAVASSFALFVLRTLRALRTNTEPPDDLLENAIALTVALVLACLWMAIAVGNSTALRLYATELMMVLGAALIVAVENLARPRHAAWPRAVLAQPLTAADLGAGLMQGLRAVGAAAHTLRETMAQGLRTALQLGVVAIAGVAALMLMALDEFIILLGILALGCVLLALRAIRAIRAVQTGSADRLSASWRWSHTWTRHTAFQAFMTSLERLFEALERRLRAALRLRRPLPPEAPAARVGGMPAAVSPRPRDGLWTEYLSMRHGVRRHLESWDDLDPAALRGMLARLIRSPGRFGATAWRNWTASLQRAWRARLPS